MTNQLPPEIYRRRRIAAVVILVVLLLLIAWIVKAIAGNDTTSTEATASRTDGQSQSPSADPKAPYSASTTASASASAESSASEEPSPLADKKDCTLQDLELVASTDRPNYGTEQPELVLTLKNPTGGTCKINLDQNTLRFEVYELESYKRVWSDLDCHASEGKGIITIEPGKEVVYSAKWSRLSSAPGKCTEADRQPVGNGAYLLYGLVGDRNSEAYTFNMG